MSADISELIAFAAGLRKSAHELRGGVYAVVSKAGLNVKTQARKNLHANHSGSRSSLTHKGGGPWLEASITYDVEAIDGGRGWEADVGPDQSISGLGVGTEFGSIHHGPIPFLIPAFDEEAPRLEQFAGELVDKAFGL